MRQYALRRILLLVPTLWTISLLIFFSLRTLPARDAIDIMLGEDSPNTAETRKTLEKQLGIDGPLTTQYVNWLGGVLTGDFGKSLSSRQPISHELTRRIPVSLELSLVGLFFTWAVSFPLGVISSLYQDRLPDYILRGGAYLIDAVPAFVIGILLITYLAVNFRWVPPPTYSFIWDDPVRHIKIMILPIIVVAIGASGNLIRFTRTFMLEVLRQDYVRTARAKGLAESLVLRRHVLRNVALPFITIIGATIPALITSSVIIENLFSLPGMGRYLVSAARNLDYPVIQATTMIFTTITLTSQLLTDLSYAWFDPRVTYGGGNMRMR
jgi:peptide/nickel transport system permease protein